MVNVIAEMEIRENCMEKLLPIVKELVPIVRAEKGCIKYEPNFAVDDEGHQKYFYFVDLHKKEGAFLCTTNIGTDKSVPIYYFLLLM